MNCIIVDDDELSRNALTQLIKQVDYLILSTTCSGPMEAIETLKKERIDLVFLDIEMPGMSGLEFLKLLDSSPLVIFTTSHKEYALEAFEYNVVDYLVKPVLLPRFMKAVSKAKEIIENAKSQITNVDADYFFIKSQSVLTKVPMKDIQWIEALGDYITIHTSAKRYVLHLTLKAIEPKLPQNKFIRVHRSYIVNLENITSVEDTTISIGSKLVPIGALYKDNFYGTLNLL